VKLLCDGAAISGVTDGSYLVTPSDASKSVLVKGTVGGTVCGVAVAISTGMPGKWSVAIESTADSHGTVRVNFDIPADIELGDHTVTFDGAKSGTAEVGFTVTEGALAPTGGAVVAPSPGLWPVAAALSLATLLGIAITRRRLPLSAPRWRRQI